MMIIMHKATPQTLSQGVVVVAEEMALGGTPKQDAFIIKLCAGKNEHMQRAAVSYS